MKFKEVLAKFKEEVLFFIVQVDINWYKNFGISFKDLENTIIH